MEVTLGKSVKKGVEKYLQELLSKYPISKERAIEKYNNLCNALLALGENPYANPVCVHKDLGQRLNKNGEPKDKYLRRFNYQDKSGFQWAFAYVVDEGENIVAVNKMMPASLVKEDKSGTLQGILNLMERVMNIRR